MSLRAPAEPSPTVDGHHDDPMPGDPPPRVRSWSWLRDVPGIVWWITALHVCAVTAYTILLPTYRAPDEQLHVDLAHVVAESGRYPAWDEVDTGTGIEHSLDIVRWDDRSRNLTADEAPPRSERPSIDALEDPALETAANQLPQHPPLYYLVAGGALRAGELVTGDPLGSFDAETWYLRMLSVALVAPLPLIIWRTADRLRASRPVAVAATLVPLAIPQLVHMGASVNNDSLSLLVFWLLTPVVLRVAQGDLGTRAALLCGGLTAAGLLTKGFAVVMPVWVAAAAVIAWWRAREAGAGPFVHFGLVSGGMALVAGGWWWIRNWVLYGELQPSRYNELVAPNADAPTDFGLFLERWSYFTTRRFWGEFGWFDTHISGVAVGVATAVVVTALAVGCRRRSRVTDAPVTDRLLLAAPLLLLVSAQFVLAIDGYVRTGVMPGLQGRYWFGAVAGLSVIVAVGLGDLLRGLVRWLPLVVLGAAVAMQVLAVGTILRFYWGEPDSGLADRARAVVAWAPIPGEVIGVGAAVAAAVAAATVALLVTAGLRPRVR
jgi:small subunit ribosomal protein S36